MDNLNIFCYESRNKEKFNELENNLTRAFLNVLKNNNKFCKEFLNSINIRKSMKEIKNLNIKFQANEKIDKLNANKEVQKFIFIYSESFRYNEKMFKESTSNKNYTRPDGLIYDQNCAILIESKLNLKPDEKQNISYIKNFFGNKVDIQKITWEAIYDKLSLFINRTTNKKKSDSKQYFIVHEFLKYMEMINMKRFDGIPYFEKLNDRPNYDKDNAREILKSLSRDSIFIEILNNEDLTCGERQLSGYLWNYIYKLCYNDFDHKKQPHIDISINEKSFEVAVMLQAGKKRNYRGIINNYGRFIKLLKKLKDDRCFFLEIIDYHKLGNLRKNNHQQTGDDYRSLYLNFQIYKIFEEEGNSELISFFELLKNYKTKNIQIKKIFDFNDTYYQKNKDMKLKKICLNEISVAINKLILLYEFFIEINKL